VGFFVFERSLAASENVRSVPGRIDIENSSHLPDVNLTRRMKKGTLAGISIAPKNLPQQTTSKKWTSILKLPKI